MNKNLADKFSNKQAIIIIHVLVWLFIFSMPYLFNSEYASYKTADEITFQKIDTFTNFFWMIFFYLNVTLLMPTFFYKNKYGYYFLGVVGLFCLVIFIHGALFKTFGLSKPFNFFISSKHNLIPFLFTVFIGMLYSMIIEKIKADASEAKIKQENLKNELSFLRSQINPHFLFNVLNNIAALARLKSVELEPTIMKLSSLMHYMLYETDDEKVVIKSEVEFLSAYIDLQKQRFGDELKMEIVFDIKEDWHSIEPMLLIPFIENAFKHGGNVREPEIEIRMLVAEQQLNFNVKNKKEERDNKKDKTSGIGLANVKRRLDLLYPSKHSLILEEDTNYFIAELSIKL